MNKRIVATVVTAASVAALTLTAPAANASASGCNGDVCIYLSDPSGGKVSVRGWAYNRTFYGRFHLTGPDGISQYSIWNTNHAGAAGHTFTAAAIVGQFCITAQEYGVGNIGTACENVE